MTHLHIKSSFSFLLILYGPIESIHSLSQGVASASFGGVPSFNRCALAVRGGEVLVADTQADLDAILINANGALVVVDHWARYVSSYTVPLGISLLDMACRVITRMCSNATLVL